MGREFIELFEDWANIMMIPCLVMMMSIAKYSKAMRKF